MSEAFHALEALLEERRLVDAAIAAGERRELLPHQVFDQPSWGWSRATLAAAAPYFWAREQSRLVDTVAPSVPMRWTPLRETCESEAGFFYFGEPLPLPRPPDMAASRMPELRALLWRFEGTALQALWFIDVGAQPGPPSPMWAVEWPVDCPLGTVLRRLRAESPPSDLADGTAACQERAMQVLGAAFAFLEQRIVIAQPERMPRFVRRRLPVSQQDATVRVVTLRRQVRPGVAPAGEHPVAWSCRWIVRGHWRDHWFPSLGRHRPLWILPYEKGPEEQPLRMPGATIFAVTR